MSYFNVRCDFKDLCTSSQYNCQTCTRNKSNKYSDKFSMKKGGYDSLSKWFKDKSKLK